MLKYSMQRPEGSVKGKMNVFKSKEFQPARRAKRVEQAFQSALRHALPELGFSP
jgi:hypothetical protein